MSTIKTRDISKGTIKTLDLAGSSMHRMKEQAIRSKIMDIGGSDEDGAGECAQERIMNLAGGSASFAADIGSDLGAQSRLE